MKLNTFEKGVYDVVAHFNVENLASLLIYDAVGVERGYWTVKGCIADNNYRVANSCRQSSVIVKSRRRFLRGQRKVKFVKTKNQEGKVYGAGMAS